MSSYLRSLFQLAKGEMRPGGNLELFLEAVARLVGESGALPSATGLTTVDVSGSGPTTLTTSQIATWQVRLSGALTGTRTVSWPAGTTGVWVVENASTGAELLRVRLSGGQGDIYVLPGMKRLVLFDGTTATALDNGIPLVWQGFVTLAGAVGVNNYPLVKMPGAFLLQRADYRVNVSPSAGSHTVSVGVTAGGAEILAAQALPAAGTLVGEAVLDWGPDMAANGSASYNTDQTIYLVDTIATAPSTDGLVQVLLIGVFE
jgi:hypothetical protein